MRRWVQYDFSIHIFSFFGPSRNIEGCMFLFFLCQVLQTDAHYSGFSATFRLCMPSYLPMELQCFHRYYKTNANTSQLNGIPTWNKQQESPNELLLFFLLFFYFICFLHPFQINPFIISTRLDVCMCVRLFITVRIPLWTKFSTIGFYQACLADEGTTYFSLEPTDNVWTEKN